MKATNNTNWNQNYYTKKELKNLSKYIEGIFLIDENGFVNVNGNVHLYSKGLTTVPVKFGKVTGYFWCSDNLLTSLKGCPYYVGGYFGCSDNNLTSLEDAPRYVDGDFGCRGNKRKFSKIEILKHSKVIRIIDNL